MAAVKINLKKDFTDGNILYGQDLNAITAPVESAVNMNADEIDLKADKSYVDNLIIESGTGDMVKAMYDPNLKLGDAFNMDNMENGATNKVLTATEKAKLDGIETGAQVNSVIIDNVLSTDATKVLSAKQGGILASSWLPLPTTLTYSTVDGATGTVTTGADTTGYLSEGMKIKFSQSQSISAYYPLNSNSVDSIGGLNGTDTNVTYTTGKFGNAWTGNGTSSKTTFTDNAVFKPTGAFTIGCWIKTSITGTAKKIFQSYSLNSPASGFQFFINTTNTLGFLTGKNTGVTLGTDYTTLNGTSNVCDGNWHYICVAVNNNYAQIYLDGKLEAFGYVLMPVYALTNYVRLGSACFSGTDSDFMNGQIDDFFIINGYALDEQTIKAKYLANTAQGTNSIVINKMFFINPNITTTSLGIYGGTDFVLTNSPITNIYYSNVKNPYGFNLNSNKWSLFISNTNTLSQNTPTANTWYNIGSLSITFPIGAWDVEYYAQVEHSRSVAGYPSVYCALSTSNNSVSDVELQTQGFFYSALICSLVLTRKKSLNLTSPTVYYLIERTDQTGTDTLSLRGSLSNTIIRAKSQYL